MGCHTSEPVMRVSYTFSMKLNWGFISLGKHDLNFYIPYFLNLRLDHD